MTDETTAPAPEPAQPKPPATVKVDPKCLAARRASITTKADKAMSILRAAVERDPLNKSAYGDPRFGKDAFVRGRRSGSGR